MTCIAGIVERGEVWMGADSGGVNTSTWTCVDRADSKLFRVGEFTIGYTSSFRMGQLLRFGLTPPTHEPGVDAFEFMCTAFVEAVRKRLTDAGFAKKENNVEHGGNFLVGYRGRLFQVESDFQVGECAEGYQACGSGEAVALGSLHTTRGLSWEPQNRIVLALQAAAHHNIGVRGPFTALGPERPSIGCAHGRPPGAICPHCAGIN